MTSPRSHKKPSELLDNVTREYKEYNAARKNNRLNERFPYDKIFSHILRAYSNLDLLMDIMNEFVIRIK